MRTPICPKGFCNVTDRICYPCIKEGLEPRADAPGQCVHYWIIAVANGKVSPGRCQHCGERRTFSNVVGDDGGGNWVGRTYALDVPAPYLGRFERV